MEGKHITRDHYQHEHHNSAGTEETHHRRESHSGWACPKCGWTHPNQHPSAKQRRNHKKHCGKLEGFKLINSGDTEKKGASSEEVSSDEEHKSTGHTEKEGKHITTHQHQHEQQLHPTGTEENHHTKERHGYVCHRCGWTYPNPHPNAKHRKKHKKICGKIEGFTLISSGDKEIQGGSSDDESSDDELKSADHENLSFLDENNVSAQKNASPSTSDSTSSNLGISSSEVNVGASQTLCISDNATLDLPKTTVIDANARNSIMFSESGKETLVESTVTTVGLGMHGLNVSGTVEPSKNLIGSDILISEDKSNLFHKEIPDTDNSQYSSGSVEHQELPVNGHQLQNPSRIQAPRSFGKSAASPVHAAKDHNIGIGSRRVGIASILSFNGLNSGNLNPKVSLVEETPASADTKVEETPASADTKIWEETEYPHSESIEKAPVHQQASSEAIIPDQERSADGSSTTYSKAGEWKEAESCALMDSNSETCRSEYAVISDEKKTIAEHDMISKPGDYIESKNISLMHEDADRYRKEEKPQNFENSKSDDMLHPEEEKEKIINQETMKGPSSEGIESTSEQKIDERAKNVVIPAQETSSTDSFPTEYSKEGEKQETECSTITSCRSIDYDEKDYNPECRRADSTAESIVMPATDIVRNVATAVNEVANENREAIKGPTSEGFESTSGHKLDEQASSSNIVIPDQETSRIDSFPTEYSKEGEKQQTECSTIELETKDYNPDCIMVDSKPENIVMPATDIVKDADTSVNEVANENQEAVKGLSSEVIGSTSGLKVDEQASNVVIPYQETSGTDRFSTKYSKEGEKHQTECSSITSSSTIEHETKDYNSDCIMVDSTPENIVMPVADIVKDADTPMNEVANENREAIKGPSSEGIEYPSGQKLDEQASNVVIPDQETSGTVSFPTEYSKGGEKQETECSSITSSSTIEHDFRDYNTDCRIADPTPENIVVRATDNVRDADTPINEVANENRGEIKGPSSEGIESTSGLKLDEQASNVVIPDQDTNGTGSFPTEYSEQGEKQQTECSSITSSSTIEHDTKDYNPDCRTADSTPENIVMPATDVKNADTPVNEVANEKSALAESHYPESTVEEAISVNPAEYIESKEISQLEEAKVMKEPCSGGIETTSDQKLISQASSKLVITDEAMSSADSPRIEYSGLGETQQNECNTPTNSSIIEPCVRDSDPDSKNDYSVQGNIMMPDQDVDRDGHINAYINAQESLSEAAATEVVHANSAASESVQSNTRNTYSSSQDITRANFGDQVAEEELQYKHHGLEHPGVEQSDQFKVDNANSATTTVEKNSLQLNSCTTDGHEDSSKESMDDVHGSKTESLKTCEPALWEQLLENNAKELNNPEMYEELRNVQQSPDNPFTYGQSFSRKEEAHQTFHIEGAHGQISEQHKNSSADMEAPADMFEAPSFMTLVETSNHSEIQPNADLAPPGSQNGELSTEVGESESERPHTPLRNLLAEENMRGTQDRSKQDPLLVEQPKPSSQNGVQGVDVTDKGGTSSLDIKIAQKDSNSSSKKIAEKVWNSPARLPSPKVEKQKVKVKSAWSMCLCGSTAN